MLSGDTLTPHWHPALCSLYDTCPYLDLIVASSVHVTRPSFAPLCLSHTPCGQQLVSNCPLPGLASPPSGILSYQSPRAPRIVHHGSHLANRDMRLCIYLSWCSGKHRIAHFGSTHHGAACGRCLSRESDPVDMIPTRGVLASGLFPVSRCEPC